MVSTDFGGAFQQILEFKSTAREDDALTFTPKYFLKRDNLTFLSTTFKMTLE